MVYALLASITVALIYFYDFFQQARYGTKLQADTYYHIQYVRTLYYDGQLPKGQRGYPLFFYIIYWLFLLLKNYTYATMLFCVVWAGATNLLQIYFIKRFVSEASDRYVVLAGSALSFVWPITTNALSIVSGYSAYWKAMLKTYLMSGATAPYQSLTYLCSKPFAILSLLFFWNIFEAKDNSQKWKNAIIFGVSLLLSVLAKPNFYQAFAPAGVIVTLIYLKRHGWGEFKRCCIVALAYIPATVWVLYAMTLSIQPIGISPFEGVFYFYQDTPLLVILIRAILYVLVVAICNVIYKNRDDLLKVGFLIYCFGTLEWLMLIFPLEKGALDMMWGYNVGMYLLFLTAVVSAYRLYLKNKNKIIFASMNILLGVHAIIGVLVFILIWWGRWIEFFSERFG